MDAEWIAKLHGAVAGLKRLVRTGWRQRGVPEPESVAAHSYGVALLTLVLAERRAAEGAPVDVLAAVRMALLHDLPESATGDLTPVQRLALLGPDPAEAKQRQRAAERRALVALLDGAPDEVRARWEATWAAYRDGTGPEARLVHEADVLDCALQGARYRGEACGEALDEFRRLVDELEDPSLRATAARAWVAAGARWLRDGCAEVLPVADADE